MRKTRTNKKDTGNIVVSLEAALDAAAPDGGSWLAGQEAFWATLQRKGHVPYALYRALDAAAPDGGSWLLGETVFWETMKKGPAPVIPATSEQNVVPRQQALATVQSWFPTPSPAH